MLDAHIKIIEKEPKTFQNFGVLKVLSQENDEESNVKKEQPAAPAEALKLNDDDQKLFFGEEFSDSAENSNKKNESDDNKEQVQQQDKLIDYDDGFDEFMSASSSILLPSQLLMDDPFTNNPSTNVDLLGSLVPSQVGDSSSKDSSLSKNASKKSNDVSKWFKLFSELDPFNQQNEVEHASENMHAA